MTAFPNLETGAELALARIEVLREQQHTVVVLIDGHAGSGKSTLTKLLSNLLFKQFEQAPHVIHMDHLYPGWEGLGEGSLYLLEQVLTPLRNNQTASWQVWNWARGRRGANDPGNGWRSFEGGNVLLVDGCGSISRASSELADLRIWVESPFEVRKARFLARDSGRFASHFDNWSMQEQEFYQAEHSKELSELIIAN